MKLAMFTLILSLSSIQALAEEDQDLAPLPNLKKAMKKQAKKPPLQKKGTEPKGVPAQDVPKADPSPRPDPLALPPPQVLPEPTEAKPTEPTKEEEPKTPPPEIAQSPPIAPKEEAKPATSLASEPLPAKKSAKKIAVLDVRATGTTDPKIAEGLTTFIAIEVGNAGYQVFTSTEIQNILGFERQKQLLGCNDDSSCLAELGGALGADLLLDTEVSQLEKGGAFRVTSNLQAVNESKSIKRSGKKVLRADDLYDAAKETTAEVLAILPPIKNGFEEQPSPPTRIMRVLGIGTAVAGAAAMGTGAVFRVMENSDYASATGANGTNRAEFDARKQSGIANSERATVCLAAGGAALAVGAVLIIIDAVRHSAEPPKSANVVFTGNGVAGTW